ncbi:MAG: hypothetical protein HY22_07960 [[Candidatus Thermochlorobacteriaceae] bacterium GBChlB]|nr:MAG: hypothetical protein HY22_07960 [[Candidatus Thermochlorobacteriaceae] bacterium GBChlB]
MKVALFGGTFDPPHNGHIALLTLTRELFSPDRIVLSVSRNPLKASVLTPDTHRLALAELLADEINATGNIVEVNTRELRRKRPSYTIDTLKHLTSKYPNADFLLCIGEDNYRNFSRWKSPEKILAMSQVAVFSRQLSDEKRPSFSLVQGSAVRYVKLDFSISATDIRAALSKGDDVSDKLPRSILRYIAAHGLYQAAL